MSMRNLEASSEFKVITALGVLAICVILPLASWRALRGEWVVAAVDIAILLGIAISLWRVHHGGDRQRIKLLVAIGCSIGAVAVAWLEPDNATLWSYPLMIANAMLAGPWRSLLLNLLMTLGVILRPGGFHADFAMGSYVTTSILMMGFAFAYSLRSETRQALYRNLALQDGLTGIGNRRAMEWRMQSLIHDARRHPHPLGLMLLDLDHFKRVNDTWGHDRGDELLREFVALVQRWTRASDELFRMGGEEFVLILPGADDAALHERALHLQARLREELLCEGVPITASIGTCTWVPGETPESWIARADAAMYAAKNDGRDAIVSSAHHPHLLRDLLAAQAASPDSSAL